MLMCAPAPAHAATGDYDIGSPTLQDVWVSTSGSDSTGDGASRATAFASLSAAWNNLPTGVLSGTGYRIRLTPGFYHGAYLEDRIGSTQFLLHARQQPALLLSPQRVLFVLLHTKLGPYSLWP